MKLAPGTSLYDPADPMGKMFFNILATFAEFEGDLIRLRTREGTAIARSKGKLRESNPNCLAGNKKNCTGRSCATELTEKYEPACLTYSRST